VPCLKALVSPEQQQRRGSGRACRAGVGGSALHAPIRDWATSAVYFLVAAIVIARAVRVAESRLAWIVIAIGISLYGAGNLVWSLPAHDLAQLLRADSRTIRTRAPALRVGVG
jgi:hypothetical protein